MGERNVEVYQAELKYTLRERKSASSRVRHTVAYSGVSMWFGGFPKLGDLRCLFFELFVTYYHLFS